MYIVFSNFVMNIEMIRLLYHLSTNTDFQSILRNQFTLSIQQNYWMLFLIFTNKWKMKIFTNFLEFF